MGTRERSVTILLAAACLGLTGCAAAGAATTEEDPNAGVATVEAVAGSDLARVTLTAESAGRLGVSTESVRSEAVDGISRIVVPYAAIIYDAEGAAFVYTSPEPMVFVRAPVTVGDVRDDVAVVTGGLPVGTPVVTVGVAELWGTETGVGEE